MMTRVVPLRSFLFSGYFPSCETRLFCAVWSVGRACANSSLRFENLICMAWDCTIAVTKHNHTSPLSHKNLPGDSIHTAGRQDRSLSYETTVADRCTV